MQAIIAPQIFVGRTSAMLFALFLEKVGKCSLALCFYAYYSLCTSDHRPQLLHGVGEVASAFISFSKADVAWVRESLHEALLAQSRVIWADWEDQPPSAEWTEFVHDGIEQHVRSCFETLFAFSLNIVYIFYACFIIILFQVQFP
jgi:hypothetical protein